VKFAPGQLQVEEAKQEAAETRMPTLPLLPTSDYSTLKETDQEHEQLDHGQRGALEELSGYEARTCSTLEASAGFYLKCKKFLPIATPEQHFHVFGISRPLSRDEWHAFTKSGKAQDEE
jgi:hypothetical protein